MSGPRLRTLAPRLRRLDTGIAPRPKKTADPFYLSRPWRDLMARLVQLRGARCEACGTACSRIFGDHVVELQDGGAPLDPGNVRLLCGSCHTSKTLRARAERQAQHHPRKPLR